MYFFEIKKRRLNSRLEGYRRLPSCLKTKQKAHRNLRRESWQLPFTIFHIIYLQMTQEIYPTCLQKNANLQMTVTTYLQMTQQKIQASARRCPSWCNLLHILVTSSLSDWGWCTFPDQMVAFSPSSCCLGMFATPQPEFCRKKKHPFSRPNQKNLISVIRPWSECFPLPVITVRPAHHSAWWPNAGCWGTVGPTKFQCSALPFSALKRCHQQ